MRKLASSIFSAAILVCLNGGVEAADPKASRFYEDALRRYESNDMSGAIIQLKNALQQDRQILAVHVLLGKALLANGDAVGAEVAFDEALRQGVNRAEVVVPLAQAYSAQGKFETLLNRVTPDGLPRNVQVEVLLLRGSAQADLDKLPAAMRSFEEARALDPDSVPVRLAQAAALIRTGQLEAAGKLVDEVMKLAPNSAAVWDARASLLHLRGDFQGALTAYGKSIALNPKNVDARVARAGLLLDFGRTDEAGKEVDELLRLSPLEPRGNYLKAVLASRKNDSATVRAALGEVVKLLDPVPPDVLSRYKQLLLLAGLAHHGLGDVEKAKAQLLAYVRLFPREVGAAKLLASIYIDSGDYTQALSLLEPLQKTSPNDPKILSLLASAHMAQRRYGQATALLDQAVKMSGGASDMRADLGFSLIGGGQLDVGFDQLQQAFAKDPGQARTGMALAMLHLRKNQPKKALEVIEAVVKREPENLSALSMLGTIRAVAGDAAGSRKAYEQALARDAGFYPATIALARLDAIEGKADVARSRLLQLLKTDPNQIEAMFEMALVEERAGNIVETVRWLEKARSFPQGALPAGLYLVDVHLRNRSFDQALNVAKDTLSKSPGNLAALTAVSRSQIALGDTRSARDTLAEMTRLAGYGAPAQVAIARLQRVAGNNSGARYSLEKALSGTSDHLPALVLMAELEIAQRDYAKAEQWIKQIGQKYPGQAVGLRLQGDLALARGQNSAALNSYRAALAKEASSDTVLRLYRAHLASGESAKAAGLLEGWMRDHPSDLPVLWALADNHSRTGNFAGARNVYERLLQLQPDNPIALNNLAQTLLKQGDRKALDYAEKAVRVAANEPGVIDTLGWVLIKQGQLDRGIGYLRDARLRDPSNPEVRFHLAVALAQSGRKTEARDELTQALKSAGNFEGIEEARSLLKDMEK